MLPSFLTTKFISGVVREWPAEAFIGGGILPLAPVASMENVFDVIKRDARLAPFCAINAESPIAEKADFARVLQDLAVIREKEVLNEDELENMREPGSPDMLADNMTGARAAAAAAYLRRTSDRMAARVNARVEWMRWNALLGTIAVTSGPVQFSVDTGIPSANKVTPDGADWDSPATAVPAADINQWAELARTACGRVITRAYCGANIAGYLAQNTAIQSLLKENGRAEALMSNNSILAYLGSIFGIQFVRYDSTYVDSNGTAQYFLPADKIIFTPEPRQADGEVLGDTMTGPAKANGYQSGIYGWVKEEEDPWITSVGAGIHAFPRLYHPNWIIVATVAS